MGGFSLTKWYLDCVDDQGRAVIAYWLAIRWRSVQFTLHSVGVYEPAGPGAFRIRFDRLGVLPVAPPIREREVVSWQSDRLGVGAEFTSLVPAFEATLLDRPGAAVRWRCEAARAATRFTVAGLGTVEGLGYAECVSLNVAPWQLPLNALRWGRWIARDGTRSVVWIDWRGAHRVTRMFVDGVGCSSAIVTDDRIEGDGWILQPTDTRTLHARSLGDIARKAGPIQSWLPAAWLAVEDRKQLSRCSLSNVGARSMPGWAIHERVRFPG